MQTATDRERAKSTNVYDQVYWLYIALSLYFSSYHQLSRTRDMIHKEQESGSHQRAMIEKDKEIKKLSESVQALNIQLQEALDQQTATDDKGVDEEHVDDLLVKISDLTLQLTEGEVERKQMKARMEADLEVQREMRLRIETLEKEVHVSI